MQPVTPSVSFWPPWSWPGLPIENSASAKPAAQAQRRSRGDVGGMAHLLGSVDDDILKRGAELRGAEVHGAIVPLFPGGEPQLVPHPQQRVAQLRRGGRRLAQAQVLVQGGDRQVALRR